MGTTTTKGVPYPVDADPPDVPADMQLLAEWVDARPGIASLTSTQRDALSGASRWTGRTIFNTTLGYQEVWNGSAWLPPMNVYCTSTTTRDAIPTAQRQLGMIATCGTVAGTGAAMPRTYLWDGAAWVLMGHWGATGRIGCELSRTQSIANSTFTDVSTYTEVHDPDGWYSGTGTSMTVPAGFAGLYVVSLAVFWGAGPGTSSGASLVINAASFSGALSSPMATSCGPWTGVLAAGTPIRAQVIQNSGGAINATVRLAAWRIGP